ncbi:MAG: hypothetical protein AAGG45_07685 [Pseudomonadota bacterium]
MGIQSDIEKIEAGWSARQYIVDRASRIRSLVKAGALKRAEELAFEIVCLQEADQNRIGVYDTTCPADQDEWQLTAGAWAEQLIHAHRMNRSFFVPVGASVDEVLREAKRVKFNNRLTFCDIEPVYPTRVRMVAE